MIVICPECGAENHLTAEICQECGASLLGIMPTLSSKPSKLEQDDLELFAQDANDLPDLLNALKNKDTSVEEETFQGVSQISTNEQSEELQDHGEDKDNETVPDWLQRIRKRAREEKDSVGEITQKIIAAQESLEDEKKAEEHENYDSWIHHLRRKTGEEAEKDSQPVDESGNLDTEDSHWLSQIKKAQGKAIDEDRGGGSSDPDDRKGDSLLQWMVELEEDENKPQPILESGEEKSSEVAQDDLPIPVIEDQPDPDATQPLDRDELRFEPPELSISREEQKQADQFTAIIVDERATRPAHNLKQPSLAKLVRLILGILLMAGLGITLFNGGNATVPQGLLQPQNESLLQWVDEIPEKASILIVFDYSPGYASELELIADPILKSVIQVDSSVTIVSSNISGSLLAGKMLDESGIGEIFDRTDLGYIPVPAFGAYGMAIERQSEWISLDLSQQGLALPASDYSGVLILSDSYESARMWIEQLSALMPETPMSLLTTAQAGPMLLPYWESGQVVGMISGISEAAGVESALTDRDSVAGRWRAYQIGILTLIALLVIGVIFNGDQSAAGSHRGDR